MRKECKCGCDSMVHRRYLNRISIDLCRSLYVNQIQVALESIRIACDSDTFLVSTKIYEMFESMGFRQIDGGTAIFAFPSVSVWPASFGGFFRSPDRTSTTRGFLLGDYFQ